MPLPYRVRPRPAPRLGQIEYARHLGVVHALDILQALASAGGLTREIVLQDMSGYTHPVVHYALTTCVSRGWVAHLPPTYCITERGKIVNAIQAGRRARACALKHAPNGVNPAANVKT